MDIEIVALSKVYATEELVHQALDAGADLVGGSPHSAPDPLGDLARSLRPRHWTTHVENRPTRSV